MVLLLLVPEPGDGGQQLGVRLLVSPSQLPDLVVVVLRDRLLSPDTSLSLQRLSQKMQHQHSNSRYQSFLLKLNKRLNMLFPPNIGKLVHKFSPLTIVLAIDGDNFVFVAHLPWKTKWSKGRQPHLHSDGACHGGLLAEERGARPQRVARHVPEGEQGRGPGPEQLCYIPVMQRCLVW